MPPFDTVTDFWTHSYAAFPKDFGAVMIVIVNHETKFQIKIQLFWIFTSLFVISIDIVDISIFLPQLS